jgi:hypothetical protein
MEIKQRKLKKLRRIAQRRVTPGKITIFLESWPGIRRILSRTSRVPRLQLGGGFGEFLRNFAEKLRGAPLGFRRDFFFNKAPEPRELFVEAVADFFEFVHFPPRRPLALRAGKRMGAIPVL